MNTNLDIEDVLEAFEAGRAIREHGPYRIMIGDELLDYHPAVIADPMPTGRQILEAADVQPILEFSLYQLFRDGQLKELLPDDSTDLRKAGVEKFIVFRSDRSYRLELDGKVFDWGAGKIQGRVLKILAKVDLATYGVWQEIPGKEDLAISDAEFANLETKGVECFFTGIVKTTEG